MKKIYSTLLITFLIIGCSKDDTIKDDTINEIVEEVVNLPPNDFDIDIINISHETATINWDEAIDPESDTVTYDIYLNQALVAENITQLTYDLIELEELTDYSGEIIAKDNENNQTEVTFSFQTEQYYLKYLKKYDYGEYSYGPNGYAYGSPHDMIKTSDNNYAIIGSANKPDGNGHQLFVLKIDYEGDQIWKAYYDFLPGSFTSPKIIEHSSGFLLSGENAIVNIDLQGNILWTKDIQDIVSNVMLISSIKIDNVGNFYITGKRSSTGSEEGNEAVLIKINSNGNLIWETIYKVSLLDEFEDLVINSQNEIYVLGSSETNGATWADYVSGDSSLIQIDFLIVKIDSQGNIIWENTYGDGRYDFPKRILIKSNDNIVFAGHGWGAYDISKGRIFEISIDGEELWNVTTDLTSTFSIAETMDGGLITTGHVDFGNYGALGIYKFSGSGIEEWNKTYQEISTYLHGRSMLSEEDGGYRIAGSLRKNYYYGEEKPELLIYKTDPEGNYE